MSRRTGSVIRLKRSVIAYPQGDRLYLNVTNTCSLRCSFCPKTGGDWRIGGRHLRLQHEPTLEEIVAAVGDPGAYREVVFAGLGEPTMRLYTVLEAGKEIRRLGGRVRLDTDGLANLRHDRDITADLEGHIDALSVSLNAQDDSTYNRYCRPRQSHSHGAVRDFADRACDFVPEVTLTAIAGLPGVDLAACEGIAATMGADFRQRTLGVID